MQNTKKVGERELLRCYGRYKISAEAIERASEIKLKSPDISYSAIAKILQKENLVSGISGASIREALCGVGKQTNLIEKFSKDKLILRLLEIVEGFILKVSETDKNEYIDIKPIIEMIKNYRETKKSTKKPLSRKHLEEIKERKRIALKEMLLGIKHREGNCPICDTPGSNQTEKRKKIHRNWEQ